MGGFFAWLAWLFIHIIYLVEFENRFLVLIKWAWYYARLITGANPSQSHGAGLVSQSAQDHRERDG